MRLTSVGLTVNFREGAVSPRKIAPPSRTLATNSSNSSCFINDHFVALTKLRRSGLGVRDCPEHSRRVAISPVLPKHNNTNVFCVVGSMMRIIDVNEKKRADSFSRICALQYFFTSHFLCLTPQPQHCPEVSFRHRAMNLAD